MKKLDNLYVSDIEFEDSGMRGPKGDSGDAPSLGINKVAQFLYKADLKNYDYHDGEIFVRKNYPEADTGACASIFKGTLFGHNYDERYDNTAEFVVSIPARHGLNGSIGMAVIPGVLTQEMMDAETEDDLTKSALDVLPLFMIDGVNDKGVAVSMHHMPEEDEDQLTDDSGMCALFAVRYILDNASTAEEAIGLIAEKTFWYPKNDAIKAGFYLMISDEKDVFCSDLTGHSEKMDKTGILSITNFRTIGWDGDPETLEEHANGIERYDIIKDAYDWISSESDMLDVLKSIRYTGVYDTTKEEFWYSDYNGDWSAIGLGDLTIHSAHDDYAAAIAYSCEKFADRQRDGQTMQTVHTVVYDIDNLTMSVMVQEEDRVYKFCMDQYRLLNQEIERAKEAEQSIRDECAELYYTKTEVDESLEDLSESLLANVADNYYNKTTTDQLLDDLNTTITETLLSDVAENYYNKTQSDTLLLDLHNTVTTETDQKLAGKADKATNAGVTGQVLYKTANGSEWDDLPTRLPDVTVEDDNKVLTVEDGEWVASDKFADYFRYVNITVSIVSDNGGIPTGGITVTVKNDDTGDIINEAEYKGQPITFRVPRGLSYCIEQSGTWEGYHNPTPDKITGAATNDITVVFSYEAIQVPETLRELQIIVDGGNASSMKSHVGLQFFDVYEEDGVEYPIIWDLKDVLDMRDANGVSHPAVILEWHFATPTAMPFDAPERLEVDLETEPVALDGVYYYGLSGSTYRLLNVSAGDPLPTTYSAIYKNEIRSSDGSIIRRGYSNYGESAARKWLNSDGDVGEWFVPSHIGDVSPEQADTMPGFMHGCSRQILSMAKPVKVKYAISSTESEDVCDTFFIPSVDEVYGIALSVPEGTPWQDWIDATGFSGPDDGASIGRRIYNIGGTAAMEVGLRSANIGYQYITWDIKPDGSLDGYANASALRRYSPCCAVYK